MMSGVGSLNYNLGKATIYGPVTLVREMKLIRCAPLLVSLFI